MSKSNDQKLADLVNSLQELFGQALGKLEEKNIYVNLKTEDEIYMISGSEKKKKPREIITITGFSHGAEDYVISDYSTVFQRAFVKSSDEYKQYQSLKKDNKDLGDVFKL